MLGGFGRLRARLRTDAVYLHVGAQGYGPVHDAEQRAGGGLEDHGHAAAGDRAAAEGDHHEPEGDNQGAYVQVEPLRESEFPLCFRSCRGTRREEARVEEHHGGCIPGNHGHPGTAGTDFTDAQAETGELGGRRRGGAEGDGKSWNPGVDVVVG